MRIRVLILGAVAAVALTLGADASAAGGKTYTVASSFTAVGCGTAGGSCGATCCVSYWSFTGKTNLAPGLGNLRLSGQYFVGGVEFSDPAQLIRDVVLTFTAGNGDQLVLFEQATWLAADPTPTPTWTVDSAASTGRFSGFTGTGTYSISVGTSTDGSYGVFGINLSGTLTSGP